MVLMFTSIFPSLRGIPIRPSDERPSPKSPAHLTPFLFSPIEPLAAHLFSYLLAQNIVYTIQRNLSWLP